MGYTITFYDRAATPRKYDLKINGGGTALTGAATTFTTQEDSDADMFMPVRCQTGSFSYLGTNDHSTWEALIPANALSMPVKLERSGIVVWQGYIQPQVFDNEYPGLDTVEHTFPVQCPLSVLDTLDIDENTATSKGPTMTFGALLQTYIFGRLTDTSITRYYFQGSVSVVSARLNIRVMWANFLTTDSQGNITSKYSCRQVLEEFCKLFGYTCRMHGTYVYFTQPTENTNVFAYFDNTMLLPNGNVKTPTTSNRGTFSVTGSMIANMDNHEEVHPGVRKCTVKSDINKLDNLIEIPYDELYDQYNLGIPNNPIMVRALDQGDERIYYLIKEPNSNGGSLTYQNDTVSMTLYAAKFNGDALTKNKYCRFLVYDTSEVGDPDTQDIPESKKSFGWSKCVELFHGTEYTGGNTNTMFSITSKQQFVVAGGILYISWKMRQTDAGQYKRDHYDPNRGNTYPPKVTARLRIGSKYWTGDWNYTSKTWSTGAGWTDTPSTFTIMLDVDGPKSNRKDINDPQYDGFGLPVDKSRKGDLQFEIIDAPSWYSRRQGPLEEDDDNNGFVPMLDFEIGFVRGVVEEQKHSGNEYTHNGGKFTNDVNVDLIFASDVPYGPTSNRHMPAGLGYLLDSDDKPLWKVKSMSDVGVVAEDELARIIATYGNRTHRLVQLSVRDSLMGSPTPDKLSTGLVSMFPLAVSHDWREDVTTITMIEI